MAFACDLTRVGSLQFTMFQSHMNMFALSRRALRPARAGPQRRSRIRGTLAVSKVIAWHMKHFAYLIGKLRDTPEGAGTLLDNVAALFLHEGGHGLDTATGKHEQHALDREHGLPHRGPRGRPQARPARRGDGQAPGQRADHAR